MSLSSGYLIVRDGKDNVRQDTFEGIAAAFSMTPAELMVAIGKGPSGTDPHEIVHIGLYRQVPTEQKFSATAMLRGLILAQSTTSEQVLNSSGTKVDDSSRRKARRAQLKDVEPEGGSSPSQPTVEHLSDRVSWLCLPVPQLLATA